MVLLKEIFEKKKKKDFEKSMQRVKSNNCKVNLRFFVGDWTCTILFVGLCHMLSGDILGSQVSDNKI